MGLKHILSARDFDRETLDTLFEFADEIRSDDKNRKVPPILAGRRLAILLFETSTRTGHSFSVAMQALGGAAAFVYADKSSLAGKGESFEDTIKTLAQMYDAIVIRHPEKGAAERAARVLAEASISSVAIINGGDGIGEHPTQAIGDIYTIKRELRGVSGLKIAFVNDLKNGRPVHSLVYLLPLYNFSQVFLVSETELRLQEEYCSFLREHGIQVTETAKLEEVLPHVDVVYMTRVQRERFADPDLYERLKDKYVIDPSALPNMKRRAILMHPLPRNNEISTKIDNNPCAVYFKQVENGLYMRMALLRALLAPKK